MHKKIKVNAFTKKKRRKTLLSKWVIHQDKNDLDSSQFYCYSMCHMKVAPSDFFV